MSSQSVSSQSVSPQIASTEIARHTLEIVSDDSEPVVPQPRVASTTAAQRRRRHLSVYHRALKAADTPQQRAAVAARYRQLFTVSTAA